MSCFWVLAHKESLLQRWHSKICTRSSKCKGCKLGNFRARGELSREGPQARSCSSKPNDWGPSRRSSEEDKPSCGLNSPTPPQSPVDLGVLVAALRAIFSPPSSRLLQKLKERSKDFSNCVGSFRESSPFADGAVYCEPAEKRRGTGTVGRRVPRTTTTTHHHHAPPPYAPAQDAAFWPFDVGSSYH